MMTGLGLFFAHWLAFLGAIRQFFWSYTPRPVLSTVSPGLIEDGSEFSPIIHVPPRIRDLPDHINSIDVTTICLVPATLPTDNVTCSINHPEHDVPSVMVAPSHYYVFLDIPVREVPHEDSPPTSPPAQAEDNNARTNMAAYGARGLSFCPVLVGIVYIHSLLHLYMLLMIPSLFNHWFEDALVYDSLNPKDLLDFPWFLHTSLWIIPWCLSRYGIRKAIACLCQHSWGVSRESAHPPVPHIVLVRIDGEAVPVNFSDDLQANLDVGVSLTFESTSLEVDQRAAAIEGGETQDLVSSIAPWNDSGIAKEFEPSFIPTISLPTECQDGPAKAQNGTGLESFTSEFGESSRTSIRAASDQQAKCYPAFVETEAEPPQAMEEIILTLPISDTFIVVVGDTGDAEEGPGDFQHMAFLEVAVNDIRQDATDNTGDGEGQDRDPTLSPWIVVDGHGPYRSDLMDTAITTRPSAGSEDTPSRSARFAVYDEAEPAVDRQVPSGTSRPDEHPACPRALEIQLCDGGDDSARTEQVPMDPLRASMAQALLDQVAQPILSAVPSEEAVEDINILVQWPTLPPPEQPVVNLPSMMATREDVGFIEIDLKLSFGLTEDVVTRSPVQIYCPIIPAVAINVACDTKEAEKKLIPLGTKDLDRDMFEQTDTLNSVVGACGVLDIGPSERSSHPPSSSIEGLHSDCPSDVKGRTGSPRTGLWELEVSVMGDEKSSESSAVHRDRAKLTSNPTPERTLSGSMHAPSEPSPDPQPSQRNDPGPTFYETPLLSTCPVQAANDIEAATDRTAESKPERECNLFASVHAPTKISKVEIRSLISESRDENHSADRCTATTTVAESEQKPKAKPCAPNWAAMPDVVDAFRVFREAPSSGNPLRRASSIAEYVNKAPLLGIVGQKGTTTNSLNSTCVTANVQSCWMNGGGLLLVRDLVPSDPADFNLRTCTHRRTTRSHGTSTVPMQHAPHPGALEVSPHTLHHPTDTAVVRLPQRTSVPCVAELEHTLGSQRWTPY